MSVTALVSPQQTQRIECTWTLEVTSPILTIVRIADLRIKPFPVCGSGGGLLLGCGCPASHGQHEHCHSSSRHGTSSRACELSTSYRPFLANPSSMKRLISSATLMPVRLDSF